MAIKGKKGKISSRQRTKIRIRRRVSGTDSRPRLSVFKSDRHTYAQIISDIEAKTLVSASTLDSEVLEQLKQLSGEGAANPSRSTKSVLAARAVGMVLAKRVQAKQVTSVVFDRNGFVFHGRVKAVAEGAREAGLVF